MIWKRTLPCYFLAVGAALGVCVSVNLLIASKPSRDILPLMLLVQIGPWLYAWAGFTLLLIPLVKADLDHAKRLVS